MKDELEQLIINNRQLLQNEEPLEGHFERFEARLLNSSKPTRLINFRVVLKIAALVVFALLAVNQARIWLIPEKKVALTLGSVSKEYQEVEFYYTNAIQVGMNQWRTLSHEGFVSESEQQNMQKEQMEFDQMYQKLQVDLEANPTDERVINAMLEYYQARMNIITIIINKLQDAKQQKNNRNHEIKS